MVFCIDFWSHVALFGLFLSFGFISLLFVYYVFNFLFCEFCFGFVSVYVLLILVLFLNFCCYCLFACWVSKDRNKCCVWSLVHEEVGRIWKELGEGKALSEFIV